jgi:hypothetical protein
MERLIFSTSVFLILILSASAQDFKLDNYPPIWDGNSLSNSTTYMFPFKDTITNWASPFHDASIYFERTENSNNLIMRYRVVSNYSMEDLYMKDTPEMLVKLGDGTILTGKKERVTDGILSALFVIDVYFYLDNELQQKIIKYGIEKVRIAYVYTYMGLHENQIFDAFTKDCEEKSLNAGMFLMQVKNADLNKAKQDAKKKKLDYKF